MNTKDAIKASGNFSLMVLKSYFADFDDAELMRRPTAGCNHLAWQLGHLISSEVSLLNMVAPGAGPELPAGFNEHHAKENQASNDAAQFCTKQQYIELFDKVRAASNAALDALPDAQLDVPGPERLRSLVPTVGHMFVLIATHPMMHAGQFVVVRRELGKPVVI